MASYPDYLKKVMEALKRLPGVGSKSAERYAFQLLSWKPGHLHELADLIGGIPEKLHTCTQCGALNDRQSCPFCARQDSLALCVVATQRDLFSIEATGEYRGGYHVLGGLLSPIEGIGPEKLNIPKLLQRIEEQRIQEVVIALDSTLEGDTTALFLKRELEPHHVNISRLAFGLPMGSSLDYVDGGTLARALSGRDRF